MSTALMRHVTYVLLFDTESEAAIRPYLQGALALAEIAPGKHYVVVVFPASRPDAAALSARIETEFSAAGDAIDFAIAAVPEEDMSLYEGKYGLLTTQLWQVRGSIILSDGPIMREQAQSAFQAAQEIDRTGASSRLLSAPRKARVAVFRGGPALGELAIRKMSAFRGSHGVGDIVELAAGASAGPRRAAVQATSQPGTRKWWQFWK